MQMMAFGDKATRRSMKEQSIQCYDGAVTTGVIFVYGKLSNGFS
jgi:hypothetical protein